MAKSRTPDPAVNPPTGLDPSYALFSRWVKDPLVFGKVFWPEVEFYAKQRDIIQSVAENDETFVTAGHMLGKDFISAFLVLWFFLTRHPVRIVTTSADYSQLESVLWGEIRRFIQMSRVPLEHTKGGPIVVNHLHLRKMVRLRERHLDDRTVDLDSLEVGVGGRRSPNDPRDGRWVVDGISYCIGRVAARGEGMQGHHVTEASGYFVDDGIPRTLFVADEASGVDDLSYQAATTWAHRVLVIGNPYEGGPGCTFFQKLVKDGDVPAPEGG